MKYASDHWRHIIEGAEIQIRTDHESLKVYRTKKHMTKRLTKFMQEIEHYDPLITYRPGHLQTVPDSLSRMPGTREKGEPADTERFMAVEAPESTLDDDNKENDKPQRARSTKHYEKLMRYLQGDIEEDKEEDTKEDALDYEIREGKLWHKSKDIPVICEAEEARKVIEATHKDLGHYGKRTTLDAVRKRFIIASDLWEEGKVLDSCVPCQLHKNTPKTTETATIHPYAVQKPFALWEIDFVGPLVKKPLGNEYLITAIDYATSKALAYPLEQRSAESAVELLKEIVWTFGLPKKIISDNGQEFISDEFQAARRRFGIKHKRTTPGHPQTNGKVERLNHELIQRLQRITAEEGNRRKDWDVHLRQALFAFHAHTNRRQGATPFFLQYGVEPMLPTTSVAVTPITRLERAEASETRKQYVQDLQQHRTEAAEKYKAALEKPVSTQDDSTFVQTPIIPGDLVMRRPINRKSKLHPKWDGPFIVLASTDTDVYQLGTANGYTIQNLVNIARLRKLTSDERQEYSGDFWEASRRLKRQDERAREQRELLDVEVQLRKATVEQLEAQKRGEKADLTKHAQLGAEKKRRTELQRESEAQKVPSETARESLGVGKRIRRLPWKLKEA